MKVSLRSKILGALFVAATMLGQSALAQNPLTPVARVDDAIVTQFELDQRIEFLRALNQTGNLQDLALNGLIDDRLRVKAANAIGIRPTEEGIAEGMEEFASRAQLSTDEFLAELAKEGVASDTFRDFITAGQAWRNVVQARFGARAQVTDSEVDRAIALSGGQGGVRVLVSEIIIPIPEGREAEVRRVANQISRIRSMEEFSAAARSVSAAPSRDRGGRIDWLPIGNLPQEIRGQVLTLSPGQVTAPIDLPGAVALFQMRALEETLAPRSETLSVDYAMYMIPGLASGSALKTAQDVRGEVDTCDDLYGVNYGRAPEFLERETLPLAEVPQEIALELAKLDENEISTGLVRGDDTLVFLMLCGRVTEQVEDVSRDDIRRQLFNQRLTSYADSYLAELRAEANIVIP